MDGVEIAGFYNPTEEKARRAKEQYGSKDAKIYRSWQDMLEDPSIDVVHVLTPNKFHAEMTIAALESGKHVMCESPWQPTRRMPRRWWMQQGRVVRSSLWHFKIGLSQKT